MDFDVYDSSVAGALDAVRSASSPRTDDGLCFYVATGELGKGIFASRHISAGEEILRFTGRIITFREAVAKGSWQCYPLQVDHDRYIDLEPSGCFGNHSCCPNAGIVNDVFLIAIADIPRGQEIRYDYSTTMDENYWTMPCRCGARYCRGEVKDFCYLPLASRVRYLRMSIVQGFIARQVGRPEK